MIKDFVTKEQRLRKRDFKMDFKLSEGDDSWGFENSPFKTKNKISVFNFLEKAMTLFVIGYAIYFIYQVLKSIF